MVAFSCFIFYPSMFIHLTKLYYSLLTTDFDILGLSVIQEEWLYWYAQKCYSSLTTCREDFLQLIVYSLLYSISEFDDRKKSFWSESRSSRNHWTFQCRPFLLRHCFSNILSCVTRWHLQNLLLCFASFKFCYIIKMDKY